MAGMQMDHYHQHTYVAGSPIEAPKTKKIWMVFSILLVVTIFEVGFAFLNEGQALVSTTVQKWIFIVLTLVKAYYIVFSFMHLGDEKFNFKLTISLTSVLVVYFIVLMMIEGYALRDIKMITPDFFKREVHGGGSHDAGNAHGTENHAGGAHH